MEFRILGPLQAVRDDGVIAEMAPRQKALLALLLVNANSTVSIDELVDQLWPEDPPTTPKQTLRFHVSKLRDALDPERSKGESVIVTKAPGYQIAIEEDSLDAARFENLVHTGSELTESHPEYAARSLRTALALWRGPPLQDVAYAEFAQPEIKRLTEFRFVALEARINADLALGGHRELVGELRGLVEADPYREGFWRQLMLALYRSGMQADALRAFQEARAQLGEGLGIEPGSELVDLEERILLQDETLDLSLSADQQTVEIPSDVSSFVGRSTEINEVLELIRSERLVVLIGPGGIGKTRLGTAVARALGGEMIDGAVMVELEDLRNPELVPQEVAARLGVEVHQQRSPTDMLVDHLKGKKVVLVLDNCEHLLEPTSALVQEVIRRTPSTRIIATSRSPLGVAGETLYAVPAMELPKVGEPLVASDAVSLFLARARSLRSDFPADDITLSVIADICRALEGHPLSIELAAGRLRVLSLNAIADRAGREIELLGGGARTATERHRRLEDTIAWSHELLSDDAQSLFRRLAVFRGGFDFTSAEAVATSADRLALDLDVMTELVDGSLVAADVGERARFRLLESIRQYAARLLDEEEDSATYRRRHAEYFTRVAEDAAAGFGTPSEHQCVETIAIDLDNMRAALERSLEPWPEIALRLSVPLSWYWLNIGHHREARGWMEAVLESARETSVPRARVLGRLTYLELLAGQLDDAWSRLGLLEEDVDRTDDPLVEAHFRYRRGELLWQVGKWTASLEDWDAAVAAFRRHNDPELMSALVNLGFGSVAVGDVAAAIHVADQLDDPAGRFDIERAGALSDEIRARALFQEGDSQGCVDYGERAAAAFETLGMSHNEASARMTVGRAAVTIGDLDRARKNLDRSIDIDRRLGDSLNVSRALADLARIEVKEGHLTAAHELLRDAIEAVAGGEYRREVGWVSAVAGEYFAEVGRDGLAARLLGVAVGLYEDVETPLPQPVTAAIESCLAGLQHRMPADTYEAGVAAGRALGVAAATSELRAELAKRPPPGVT